LGGAPLAVILGCYNTYLWGLPWRTGYANHHELFGWKSLAPTLVYYVKWIPHLLPIGALGLLGIPFLRWQSRRHALLGVVLWALAFVGCYAFYPFTRIDWWWSRFILPAYPAMTILGALALQRLAAATDRRGRPVIAGAMAVALICASIGLSSHDWRALGVRHIASGCNELAELADWLDNHTPEDSIISTLHMSGTMTYHGRTILRWDMLAPEEWNAVAEAARKTERPVYFTEVPDRVKEALETRTPGNWTKLAQVGSMGVWRLSLD
jgi:hypothetical protein